MTKLSSYIIMSSKCQNVIITLSPYHHSIILLITSWKHLVISSSDHHIIMVWPSTTIKKKKKKCTRDAMRRGVRRGKQNHQELTPVTLKRCHQEMIPVTSRSSGDDTGGVAFGKRCVTGGVYMRAVSTTYFTQLRQKRAETYCKEMKRSGRI